MSLKYKITLCVFLPIFFVTLYVISYLESMHTLRIEQEIQEKNRKKIERIKTKIESSIKDFTYHIRVLSKLLKKEGTQNSNLYYTETYLNTVEYLIDITLISLNSFEYLRVNKYHVLEETGKKSYFNEKAYKEPLLTNQPFIGGFLISPDTSEPLFSISVPVIDHTTGTLWAVLKGTFSANTYRDFMEEEFSHIQGLSLYNPNTKTSLITVGEPFTLKEYALPNKNILRTTLNVGETKLYILVKFTTSPPSFSKRNNYLFLYFISSALFLLLFFILHLITIRLNDSTKKIEILSRQLTKTAPTFKKSDEIHKLNEAVSQLKRALQDSKRKDDVIAQQSKMAAMGEMIGAIAHQWRQPLNELGIRIQNLQYDYEDNLIDEGFIQRFIEENKETIRFMSQTIDDFRNFFRLDKEKERFSAKESIKEVISIQSAQLDNYAIKLTLEGEDFMINTYRRELQQVILNLINNAKDAILENNPKSKHIIVTVKKPCILVADNGGGIKEELQERIFEPYFTTKEPEKGTGMGLYVSKMIIENNIQGKLSFKNKKEGSVFTVCFG